MYSRVNLNYNGEKITRIFLGKIDKQFIFQRNKLSKYIKYNIIVIDKNVINKYFSFIIDSNVH